MQPIEKAAKQWSRGIVCPAEAWRNIALHLPAGNPTGALDGLPPEAQRRLVDLFVNRPWSLLPESPEPLRRAVEGWLVAKGAELLDPAVMEAFLLGRAVLSDGEEFEFREEPRADRDAG